MAVGLEMDGQQRIWGGSAGRNSNTGEAQPWPAAKSMPASSVRGLGSAKRGTEGTRELGGRRGSRSGREDGRRGRPGRRRHGRRPRARGRTQNKVYGQRNGKISCTGRERRTRRSSQRGRMESTVARGRRRRGRRTAVLGAPPCGSCGRDEAKMERGARERHAGGLGFA